MLDLLEYVRNAVGPVNLHQPRVFVDRRLVPIDMECLAGEREIGDDARLSFRTDIVVARVVPTANIKARNMIACGER